MYFGLLWAAALLFVHVEGRVLASQQQGTKVPPLPLPTLTSSKDCGIPYAHCGGSIPKDITCPKVSSCCDPTLGPHGVFMAFVRQSPGTAQ